MQKKVLALLRAAGEGYISGEEIALPMETKLTPTNEILNKQPQQQQPQQKKKQNNKKNNNNNKNNQPQAKQNNPNRPNKKN